MKLTLAFVFILVAGAVVGQDFEFDLVGIQLADIMPITETNPDDKPSRGVCFIEPMLVCDTAGALVSYSGVNNCVSCVCGDDFGVVCCRDEPYPKVDDPEKCSLYLDPSSCVYRRHPKCKHYCDITGWYYTDLSSLTN